MRDARYLRGQVELCLTIARETGDAIAVAFCSLWPGSSGGSPQNALASQKALQRGGNRPIVNREAAKLGYSFRYTNGLQTIQDARSIQFSSDRAARRGAMRTARAMANNVSWQSSARGSGWTVLVIDSMGQQVCQVPVRLNKRWL